MSAADANPDVARRLREVRERIRKRLERTAPPAPDLPALPIERLREAATAARSLAAAIGTVNPRPPGLVHASVQASKNFLARVLDWHVRPQREFNQAMIESLSRTADILDVIQENFRALAGSFGASSRLYLELAQELDAVPERFDEQAKVLDEKLKAFDEKMKLQRWAYEGLLQRQSNDWQERLAERMSGLRADIEEELRLLRQRLAAQATAGATRAATEEPASAPPSFTMDYFQLERHFRGTEEEIRTRQSFYAPFFRGRKNVLDLACGRGEFLELMRELGVAARGVDLDADMVGRCREKNLDVVQADVFAHIAGIPNQSLDGIFSAQFVEHLPLEAYGALITQCARKLGPAGVLAIETPNPECLAIFSQTFYLDPTHVRPIPPGQLRFLFAEAGFTGLSTHFLSPAGAGLPLIPPLSSRVVEADRLRAFNEAVARFNETFFGGMDYAVIGCRPEFDASGG